MPPLMPQPPRVSVRCGGGLGSARAFRPQPTVSAPAAAHSGVLAHGRRRAAIAVQRVRDAAEAPPRESIEIQRWVKAEA